MKTKSLWIVSDDLFFTSGIASQLKESDWECKSITLAEIVASTTDLEFPQMAVINLNASGYDPFWVVSVLKKSKSTKILGFCGHGQKELFHKAQEAGCDWVIPNSVAARQLLKFLITNSKND